MLGDVLERVTAAGPLSVFATRTAGASLEKPEAFPPASDARGSAVRSTEGRPRGRGAFAYLGLSVALFVMFGLALWRVRGSDVSEAASLASVPPPGAAGESASAAASIAVTTLQEVASAPPPLGADSARPDTKSSRSQSEGPPRDRAPRDRAPQGSSSVEPDPPTATLWIASDPWAYVYVDGTRVGRTTLNAYRVRPGPHVIRLENPAAALERTVEIRLAPGEDRRLSVDLAGRP
jgi:hypothetical protein